MMRKEADDETVGVLSRVSCEAVTAAILASSQEGSECKGREALSNDERVTHHRASTSKDVRHQQLGLQLAHSSDGKCPLIPKAMQEANVLHLRPSQCFD